MPQWLSCLPLREDTVEARVVHAQLVRMLEAGDPHLLGANNEHLGKVVKVFAVAAPTAAQAQEQSAGGAGGDLPAVGTGAA